MGNTSTSSLLGSSDETFNGTKLMRLILDGGTEALRNVFRNKHSGNLQVVLSCTCSSSTCTSSTCNHNILSKLKGKNIIIQKQWDKLYPIPPNQPNINDFDITLLIVLLRSICNLSPPASGWKNMPNDSDRSVEDDIVRIKLFRNKHFGHIAKTAVCAADFKTLWAEISSPLLRLGIDQNDIDRLENEKCGSEQVAQVLKEWNEFDGNILNALEDIFNVSNENRNVLKDVKNDLKILVKQSEESRSDGVLNKHLVWFNFQTEIESNNGKFTAGSREWVFEQVLTWFKEESSENRAFVISGRAGTGKSVIAAVICKRFAEHVGASHFFQYNNSQYNNPNFFLQSLAWHLCKVVPAYKEAVIEKLSGNMGKSLNDVNIEGLFSTLFKEPFSGIADPEKRLLIVLDAVDESEYYGRDELAKLISNHLHKLPSYLRFLITTRPENKLLIKFSNLNQLFIEANKEKNLNDVKLVLQDKIPSSDYPTADFINSLAQKSNGSMFYAFFLTKMYKENPSIDIDSLPAGVEECYENYLQRLEGELILLEISNAKFLRFLSAFAVASDPLPVGFVEPLFGFENPANAKRKVAKAINTLSLLFVIEKDKSISFFHKSLRDWLVEISDHDYSVDVEYGHEILFDLCVKELDKLKKSGVCSKCFDSTGIRYALKHCIAHMLNGVEDTEKLECSVRDYVADLDVMFASVSFNVVLSVNNISSLTNHELYTHVSENTRRIVNRMFLLIRKFGSLSDDNPRTFLQIVVNEGGKELSFKASNLLQTRYKDIIYLELFNKDKKSEALEPRCFLSGGAISGIDLSPQHDYVVFSYKEGGIELFSLATGRSKWTKKDYILGFSTRTLSWIEGRILTLPHCIVFHPHENLILPGRLDNVLTLEGTVATGPFKTDKDSSVFNNCCFSLDGSRMVTYHERFRDDNCLIVWNVFGGTKERCFRCDWIISLSFTTSGNFLGTTGIGNTINVYDVANNYNVKQKKLVSRGIMQIISTFDQNSWICADIYQNLQVVNHNLSDSTCHYRTDLKDIVLPSNVYSSSELQCFLQHPKQSWFSSVKTRLGNMFGWPRSAVIRYVIIDDKNVLVFSCEYNTMCILSIEGLAGTIPRNARPKKRAFCSISTNGNFVYLSSQDGKGFYIYERDSKDEYSKSESRIELSFLVVVKDGVILRGDNHILELWNCDLTQRLAKFDQLAGTKKCISVSDNIIACVCEGCINFFDVFTKKVTCQVHITKSVLFVSACSIKYHVLTQECSGEISLQKNGEIVDGWEDPFPKNKSPKGRHLMATFSPEGNKLVLSRRNYERIFVFDIVSMRIVAQIPIYGLWSNLTLFDHKYLLCGATSMIYLIDLERAEILTCLNVGDIPESISLCRKQSIACVAFNNSPEKFDLIKVCFPRK